MTEAVEKSSRKVDPKEAQELWAKQVSEAKSLVDQFRNAPEELRPAINDGVRQLTRLAHPMNPIREDKDITTLSESIADFMEESLSSDEIPDGVNALRGKRGIFFKRKPNSPLPAPQLFPNDIRMAIERFGLADGKPKPIEDLVEKYGILPAPIFGNIKKVAIRMDHFPAVSEALKTLAGPPLKITFVGSSR
jgi:hypothetical protein